MIRDCTLAGALALVVLHQSPMRAGQSRAAAQDATIVLTGEVTTADKGTYQEHTFVVPAGVTRLDVEFTHSHKDAGTQLEIGLFDPNGFRGTSRFSKERFHIAVEQATPSYVPGPIVAGTWRVSLGIPAVTPNTRVSWRVAITLSRARNPRGGLGGALNDTPGWYVGQFHAHTLHSDGYGCEDEIGSGVTRGCQPWELVEAARAARLDFLTITDHNTTTHHADLATLQESLGTLLLIRGQELTTFHGHANVYGTSAFIDFRLGFKGRAMANVLDDVERESALLSVNHPARETGDRCTGCGWDAPDTPWSRIHVLEVVNGTDVESPTAGMPFWYARLNEGHRMTGIGGSDDHAAHSAKGRIATPATVVHAAALSEAAILDGVRSGQVYVRTRGPAGPILELRTSAAGRDVPMGGVLTPPPDGPVTLRVHAARAAGQTLEIVRGGQLVIALPVENADATIEHDLQLARGQWVHVRLRDGSGITAFSNPVYAR